MQPVVAVVLPDFGVQPVVALFASKDYMDMFIFSAPRKQSPALDPDIC